MKTTTHSDRFTAIEPDMDETATPWKRATLIFHPCGCGHTGMLTENVSVRLNNQLKGV